MPLVVYVLVGVIFLMDTTEYMVAGLLPEIPSGLHASVARARLAGRPQVRLRRGERGAAGLQARHERHHHGHAERRLGQATTTVLLQMDNAIITQHQDYATAAADSSKPKAWSDHVSQRNRLTACAG